MPLSAIVQINFNRQHATGLARTLQEICLESKHIFKPNFLFIYLFTYFIIDTVKPWLSGPQLSRILDYLDFFCGSNFVMKITKLFWTLFLNVLKSVHTNGKTEQSWRYLGYEALKNDGTLNAYRMFFWLTNWLSSTFQASVKTFSFILIVNTHF